MPYVRLNVEAGTFALYDISNLRADYPTTFFPDEDYSMVGIYPCYYGEVPPYNSLTQNVRLLEPMLKADGKIYQDYEVFDLPPEVVAENYRALANERMVSITNQVRYRLEQFAKTKNFDSVDSAPKYVGLTDEQIDAMPEVEAGLVRGCRINARYLTAMAAQTWAKMEIIYNEVVAGERPMPDSLDDLEADLPKRIWPVN